MTSIKVVAIDLAKFVFQLCVWMSSCVWSQVVNIKTALIEWILDCVFQQAGY